MKTIINSSQCSGSTNSDVKLYAEVQKYAQESGIKSMRMWFDYHNVRKGGHIRPTGIPGDPSKYFERRDLWVSWPDLLGTATVATQEIGENFLDLEQAKKWFSENKIYTVASFRQLCKDGKRPNSIPSAPNKKYDVKFSDLLCPKPRAYLEFKEAREKVMLLNLTDYLEFRQYRRDNITEMKDIPCNPDKIYDNDNTWTSWPHFLGYSRLKK